MRWQVAVFGAIGLFLTRPNFGQTVPIYQVTVVERTVKAVNYQYRGGQTRIDFTGTVLLPQAKGEALVESKAGRTEIDARFSGMVAPGRFGAEYLTYVLWAITPQGHPKNLGEVVSGPSDKAHLAVTTDLQAFGMIVTAEPYSAVRQPSDVVVMENVVRPDTIGKSEPIQVRYELMPRGSYTYVRQGGAPDEGPKVSMDRYESLLAVYQAQNAVQIAQSQGAGKYAHDTLAKAEALLAEARKLEESHAGRSAVVTAAREAAQTAEDARTIAMKHANDSEVAGLRAELAQERTRREEAERSARDAAAVSNLPPLQEPQVVTAPAPPLAPPPPAPRPQEVTPQPPPDAHKTEARVRLMHKMNSYFPTVDTPRGLVVTLHDRDFRGPALDPAIAARLANLASAIAEQRGVSIEVEGHGEQNATVRAAEVRDTLLRGGLSTGAVTSRGLGTSRPLAAAGSPQNRRVEIVISGDAIGTLASWDRAYPLR